MKHAQPIIHARRCISQFFAKVSMKRKRPDSSTQNSAPKAASASRTALSLREATVLVRPIVRWLLRSGVSYREFAESLKIVFVQEAYGELVRDGEAEPSCSALSLRSGIDRKQVRAIQAVEATPDAVGESVHATPRSIQVHARWLRAKPYVTLDGQAKLLPRIGPDCSFERLAHDVSRDIHPRALLDEMMRLGLVRLEGEFVIRVPERNEPPHPPNQPMALVVSNMEAHLATAIDNLSGARSVRLEESVCADGLNARSVDELHIKACEKWREFSAAITSEAGSLASLAPDPNSLPCHQVRLGVYFCSVEIPSADACGPEGAVLRSH
ncbi:MAG: DUF6502 family protein [Burkholderiales bacterium]